LYQGHWLASVLLERQNQRPGTFRAPALVESRTNPIPRRKGTSLTALQIDAGGKKIGTFDCGAGNEDGESGVDGP
jgi:hypothetical protein